MTHEKRGSGFGHQAILTLEQRTPTRLQMATPPSTEVTRRRSSDAYGAASAAFLQLASSRITHCEEVEQLRAALLAYCKRDTLAMVEVHRALEL